MRKIMILLAAALPLFADSAFDFKQLDKLGANAKESTYITLDGLMLKMASGLMGNDQNSAETKSLLAGLKGIYIRSFTFEEDGKYNQSDLDPLRNWLDSEHWTKIVDVKDRKETSTIYALSLPENKPGGFAIVSAEPKDVTVVLIEGPISMDDLGKLGGNMGIPDMSYLTDGKSKGKQKKK